MISELERLLKVLDPLVRQHLHGEKEHGLLPTSRPEALADNAVFPLPEEGMDEAEVVRRMKVIISHTPSSSNPRFLNQLFGGRIPIGIVADILALLANSSMYTYKAAGAQVIVENEVLRRMLNVAGFRQGEGSFMPGGSIANLTAMLLARNSRIPDARECGGSGVRGTIYTSDEAHYSILKSAGILGIGRRNVRAIPASPDGCMHGAALEAAIRRDIADGALPLFVNATAGTTVRGAFDPLERIGRIARRYGLWLHVDGALGASLLLSDRHRHLLDGSAQADSLTWNPHKMMGLSLQTSVLLVAERGLLASSLDETADYLFQADASTFNPGHRSIQCGRRNDAFRLWAAWQRLGDKGWENRLNRQMELARTAASLIASDPAFQLVEPPPSINVCFRLRGVDSRSVCEKLDQAGLFKIGYGSICGESAIRLVCVNPDFPANWIETLLDAIRRVGRQQDRKA